MSSPDQEISNVAVNRSLVAGSNDWHNCFGSGDPLVSSAYSVLELMALVAC